jgi:hypothetical protein
VINALSVGAYFHFRSSEARREQPK